jgi:hypothetical protein
MDGLVVDGTGYAYLGNTAAYRGELNYDSSGNTSLTIANSWDNDNSEINFKVKTAGTGKKALQIKGNGDISFYEDTGTTPKLFWDASAESLGIGTTSPSDTLSVNGQIGLFGNDGQLKFNDGSAIKGGNNYGDIRIQTDRFRVYNEAGSNLAMNIDSSGNVGIGTSSPATKLDVTGTATMEGLNVDEADGSGGKVNLNSNGGARASLDYNNNTGQMTLDNLYGFIIAKTGTGGSSAERLRIDSAGRVGIGTISPSDELEIASSSPAIRLTDTDDSTYGSISYNVNALLLGGDSTIRCSTGGSERMRIDSSGNLLVGTTNNAVYASSSESGLVYRADFGLLGVSRQNNYSGSFNRYGTDGDILNFRKDGTTVGSISVTASATAYNTSSDQRLKENIADADDAGSKIDAIQVRKYDWKADGSHQDYGMIAQELLEVAPEAVSVPEDSEEMMGVDYSKLVPMLIKEIQSLRNRVAQLEE